MFALPADLLQIFTFDADSCVVSSREGKKLEFKQDFTASDFSEYTKALAAFANASGGVIVFGVSDRPRTIVGASNMVDEADWVNRLRDDFDPEIPFALREYKVGGHKLHAVGVDTSQHTRLFAARRVPRSSRRRAKRKTSQYSRRVRSTIATPARPA
jgi:predicted HTH transcriptional regulator